MVANTASTRPVALEPNPDGMPAALRARRQWVSWCYEWIADKGKWDKIPKNPRTGGNAMANVATTWGALDDAWRSFKQRGHDGVAYVTTADDGILILDFDGCVRADGTIEPWALFYARRLRSWAQLSVSAGGLHSVVYATPSWDDGAPWKTLQVPDVPNLGKRAQIELISERRFVCMTGRMPPALSHLDAIVHAQNVVDETYGRLPEECVGRCKSGGNGRTSTAQTGEFSPSMTDEEVLLRARNARNGAGAAFVALFDCGEIKDHGHDHSVADLALCSRLAFWTQDAAQIDKLFRKSKLMRAKWDERRGRQTYGALTVAKALELTTEHYSPPPEPEDEPASLAPADASDPGPHGAQSHRWTGPRDWARMGPVTPEEARAMTREQLEHYVVTWSRLQYDVYHLLTNQARIVDPDSGKERPVLNPTDKVTIACAWFDANRVPGVACPEGHSHVLVRRDTIARQAGVSADTVGRSIDHAAAVGLITKDCVKVVQGDRIVQDMYVGAPARMPRNTEPLPSVQDAAHRAKDRKRKTCRQCGASVFVHKTACGACGAVLKIEVDGDDEQAVNELRDRLEP